MRGLKNDMAQKLVKIAATMEVAFSTVYQMIDFDFLSTEVTLRALAAVFFPHNIFFKI